MTEKGKAHLKGSELINEENDEYSLEVDENGCAKEASDGCPVQCIHLKD
jgi:ferredoxin